MRNKQFLSGILLASAALFFSATSTALGGEISNPNDIVDPNPINFNSLIGFVALVDQPASLLDDLRDNEGIEFPSLDGGELVFPGPDGVLIDIAGSGGGTSGIIEISFVDPVLAAGVDYSAGPSGMHFLAYDEFDNLILNLHLIVGQGSGFIGIDGEGMLIKRIVMHDSLGGFAIDNLRRDPSPVPLPGAVLLGVVGLAAVGWAKRRLL